VSMVTNQLAFVRSQRAEPLQRLGALFWIQGFVLLQTGCQLGLLIPSLGPARVLVRCAAFGSSLALLAIIRGQGPGHPARPWAPVILGLVALGLLHPATNTLLSATTQCGLYLAILGPLFWVSRLTVTAAVLRRLLLLLWAFHTLSATFGVLQVLYPGQFQPVLSSNYTALDEGRLDALKVTLANGERVFRPMGLTDSPGGAASAGMYASLFGIGVFLRERKTMLRLAAIATIGIGLFCIYLSQVRSILIMCGICASCLLLLLALRGEWSRLVGLVGILATVVFASFLWAVAVGGESVTSRLSTLTDESADTVYYRNRGHFLEETVTELLPQYPFGAGLGRWGMTHQYFADPIDPVSYPLWVEIQWTGWLLDGGVPLVLAYSTALALACLTAGRIALSRLSGDLPLNAAVILAYNIGLVAVTFNYPVFIGSGGLDFWLLNAALFAAACTSARQVRRGVGPA
jgi:hypothetical protein